MDLHIINNKIIARSRSRSQIILKWRKSDFRAMAMKFLLTVTSDERLKR